MYFSNLDGVEAVADNTENEDSSHIKCMQFATISENLRHDSKAVWAHLIPVLGMIKETWSLINKFHFQSDGPTTQ